MASASVPDLDSLETLLGVSFCKKALLGQALVHSSYLNEEPGSFAESNERMEFLGDAIVGAVVAEELYRRHPHWQEGKLTQGRSMLVRTEALAQVAVRLELGRHLYMGTGEESGGGRERQTTLAAAVEAVVGAVFLDQGYDAARDFLLRIFSMELSSLEKSGVSDNPKSTLQEAVQAEGQPPPKYRTVKTSGADHARRFTIEVTVGDRVMGRGTGSRKSLAEHEAAAEALRALAGDPAGR